MDLNLNTILTAIALIVALATAIVFIKGSRGQAVINLQKTSLDEQARRIAILETANREKDIQLEQHEIKINGLTRENSLLTDKLSSKQEFGEILAELKTHDERAGRIEEKVDAIAEEILT